MKWGRDYDYHGSRTYDRNEPAIGRLSLMLHWIANVVRQRGRKLTGSASPPAITLFNFSLLGADSDGLSATASSAARRAANAPGRPAANLNARDWRVLP